VVAIYETCLWLSSKGVEKTSAMNKGGSQQVGPVKVTMTHAVHSCGIQDDDGSIVYGGEAAGYVLRLPDGRVVYFAGDTNVFSDMQLIEQLYHPELVFLPIGDLFTMGPQEAAMACCLLKPKKVIPMHSGTFPALTGRPKQLAELVKDRGIQVLPLEPGKPVKW
jgi:L-ascorbate metabolism protein UlaG (beta-lactamase superfamily)